MRNLFLAISRFAVTTWVGAAVFFLLVTIRIATSDPESINSVTQGILALLRFPWYYRFGFVLVPTALLTGFIARGNGSIRPWRMRIYLGLLAVALAAMVCDYVFIYQELARVTADTSIAKPANFQTYHDASKWIITTEVGLCLAAALLIAGSGRQKPTE